MSETKTSRQTKYNKAHTTQVTLRLNLRTEADIIQRLREQGNKQGYVKRLIREDMEHEQEETARQLRGL